MQALAVVAYAFYPQQAQHLVGVVRRFVQGHPARVVWVHAPGLAGAADSTWQALAHDGTGWEFSAYQRGLDALLAQGWVGPVAFFNDTAGRHYPLPAAELQALRRCAAGHGDGPALLAGHVEPAPAGFAWRGQVLPGWVRSNAFVLTPAALQALGGHVFDADEFAAPRWSAGALQWPPHLSAPLRDHLDRWLMGTGPQGWRHHSGRPQPTPQVLRGKAGSILLEKRMAALVLADGGRLLPCGRGGALQRLAERAFFARRRLLQLRRAEARA